MTFRTRTAPIARIALAATAGMLAMGLAGCAASASADSSAPDGTWMLVSASDANGPLPVDAGPVTLVINDGGVGGEVCNSYGGNVTGTVGRTSAGEIAISEVFSTMMWCEADGLMDLESRYVRALQLATKAQLIEGALVLAGDDVRLRFERG
ncbi:heat shock protein HslJ [Microcella alkaliphila]|uniref:Heat shock protein HslJ n=1 Tax=Microcella alkaliphila TaxID=279828 RepID=A0A4V6MD10_9MICO|nr:META domain-containing protein [Microcella alkaliphila]RZT66439.1 heat shock protein HslJ [Microcella alkaliphila]